MNESQYSAARRNRERRDDLEKRRQNAVATADHLRARSRQPLEFNWPGQPASWQVPVTSEVLIEALGLWVDRAKQKVLELDQEFNTL